MSVTKESKARTKVPRAVREPQMLDAAVAVFAERGYHGASMDEIAAGAGGAKPMVYSYFRAKEDLYLARIDHPGTRLMEAGDEAGGGGGGTPRPPPAPAPPRFPLPGA